MVDIANIEFAALDAPAACAGKPITKIAIGLFVDRGVGWIGNCFKVNRLLVQHAADPRVKKFMKSLKPRAIGVRTILDGLTEILGEPGPADKGKKRMREEEGEGPFESDTSGLGYNEVSD